MPDFKNTLTVNGEAALTSATGQPLSSDLTAIAALSKSSGLLRKTALHTWELSDVTVDAQPAFLVRRNTSSGAYPSNQILKLTWTHEDQDTTGIFDLATSSCTPEAGNWQFDVFVTWNAMTPTAGTFLQVILYKNGTIHAVAPSVNPPDGTLLICGQAASFPVIANGTDVFEIYIRQKTGVNQTVFGDASVLSTFWRGVRIPDHVIMSDAAANLSDAAPQELGTASPGVAQLSSRADHVHSLPVQPAFHVYRATNSAAVVNNVRTKYTFTTELFDPTSMFDLANNACVLQEGNWVLYMGVVFGLATPTVSPVYINFHLYKNGAAYFSPVGPVLPLYGAYHGSVATIPVFGANGTDIYELYVQHTLGASVVIASGMASFWAGVRLGG